ncbi:hypothetical protein BDN72DRAFT_792665 [Pluteus cervinus]|uniref:Uncharacterized protein n=1 Tax=Pluteus cervinus TaxID=181527 RepID=A0ACD3B3S4_9AGAR|nr:hypothetical protein BDN72DRAFT_792665 [Pluteus cervinus]
MQFLEEEAQEEQFLEITHEEEKGFECGICMDDLPVSDVAIVDYCDHALCRDCLRNYVVTQIAERKFPIPCPLCAATKTKDGGSEWITENLIQILGIPEAQFAIFEEMQLVMYSVPVRCPGCRRSVNIDRQEYEENAILACPLPGCNYGWCKNCQQAIVQNGPRHSCDGTNELDHLMTQQGWKRCPRCKTPIQKTSGCNHMTCRVPGCNTEFCYVCGHTPCQCGRRI